MFIFMFFFYVASNFPQWVFFNLESLSIHFTAYPEHQARLVVDLTNGSTRRQTAHKVRSPSLTGLVQLDASTAAVDERDSGRHCQWMGQREQERGQIKSFSRFHCKVKTRNNKKKFLCGWGSLAALGMSLYTAKGKHCNGNDANRPLLLGSEIIWRAKPVLFSTFRRLIALLISLPSRNHPAESWKQHGLCVSLLLGGEIKRAIMGFYSF